jgi:hypothetical protein
MTRYQVLTLTMMRVAKSRNFRKFGPISSKKSLAYSSVAMIARRVSIPSPFSELVTTISG